MQERDKMGMYRLANKASHELREAAEHGAVALFRELCCSASVCVHRFPKISTRMQTKWSERITSGVHYLVEHLPSASQIKACQKETIDDSSMIVFW